MKQRNFQMIKTNGVTLRTVVVTAMLGLFSSCALFRHQPTGHILVKGVSWKLVKKYAEPEAGLVGHKITIIDPSNGRVVAEKSTDNWIRHLRRARWQLYHKGSRR